MLDVSFIRRRAKRNVMQYGTYGCFDEPLTDEERQFIKKFNGLFTNVRIIYKPFNPEPRNPDLPPYDYSLGIKIEIPMIPEDSPAGLKRVAKKLGIL